MINEPIDDLPEETLDVRKVDYGYALMYNDTIVEFIIGDETDARHRLRDLREQHFKEYRKQYPYHVRTLYENQYIWHSDSVKVMRPC